MFEELEAQEKAGKGEVAFGEALAIFLTKENLQDMSLVSNDGMTVRTNRYVLASRSSYFEILLLGSFREASIENPVIQVEYSGVVLKALVEYIHKGAANLLSVADEEEDDEQGPYDIGYALELAVAALFYNLPQLCRRAYQSMYEALENDPCLAFALLESCEQVGPSVPAAFKAVARSHLRADVDSLLHGPSISVMSEDVLERIIKDKRSQLSEEQLSEILRLWSINEGEEATPTSQSKRAKVARDSPEDRRSTAKELVKHIRLEYIHPTLLAESVHPSGLVHSDQLVEAFSKQALMSKEERALFSQCIRNPLPVWAKSKKAWTNFNEVDHLKVSQEMKSGVYRWVLWLGQPRCAMVGIGLNKDETYHKLADLQGAKQGFFYGCDGKVYAGGNVSPKSFPNAPFGSKLTLTLNLTQYQPENGTLSLAVDSGAPFTIATDLIKLVNPMKGFLPVAYQENGNIYVLSMEKLND